MGVEDTGVREMIGKFLDRTYSVELLKLGESIKIHLTLTQINRYLMLNDVKEVKIVIPE